MVWLYKPLSVIDNLVHISFLIQGSLYSLLIEKVDGFRSFIGAPETERFNIVLLGGECC